MSFPAILIGLALLLATIPIVAGPLARRKRFSFRNGKPDSLDLLRDYGRILLALRDLDFDHELGVVDEIDYQQLRASLLAQAAEAYERTNSNRSDLEQRIEAAVRKRRQHAGCGQGHCANCGAGLDPVDRFCPECGLRTSRSCPQCNQAVGPSDHFCKSCGTKLSIPAGAIV